MNHYTEEELILHHYGESDHAEAIEAHLAACESCRATRDSIREDLAEIAGLPFPDNGPDYSSRVWRAVEPRLETAAPPAKPANVWRWRAPLAAAASLILIVTSLWIGYRAGLEDGGQGIDEATRRQALMTAVSLHLRSSERLLLDVSNTRPGPAMDLSGPQRRATELASSNRLYRRTADLRGEGALSSLLDELERVLLEIANTPDRMSSSDFHALWSRVERSGLLIKMRLQETEAREGRAVSQI